MKNLLCLLFILISGITVRAQTAIAFGVEIIGDAEKHAILLPGFSCSGAVWESTTEQIASHFTCHVFTMPGFAGQPASADYSMDSWVDGVAAYIKKKQLGKATILGHSMGGMMALELAAKFPDLIEQIIVVDALPSLAALNNPQFTKEVSPDCDRLISMFTDPSNEVFERNQRMRIAGMCSAVEMHDEIISWGVNSDKYTLGNIFCQLMQFDARNSIEKINCPALILLEANFKSINEIIKSQYEKLKNADLRYANKGLHFIMYDDKDWYHDQLKDFLFLTNN